MIFDIKLKQRADAACVDVALVAPELVGDYQLAELRTPVAEVIYADAFEAQKIIYAV